MSGHPTPRRDQGASVPDRVMESQRRRLLLLAYRISGSWADAEDVVQQAALEWLGLEQHADNPAGWLTKATVRRAIDSLRGRRRMTSYEGPWLPQPLIGAGEASPEEAMEHRETLTMAFMVLVEALTPGQRAVVVLRSLGYLHAEIAGILNISPGATRQHHARAVRRLSTAGHRHGGHCAPARAGKEGSRETDAQTLYMLEAFLAAAHEGDLDALASLLHADVRAYQDGGGKARAARRVLVGVRNVARFAVGVAALHSSRRAVTFVNVNGAPGAVATLSGERHVVSIEAKDGRIYRVFDVCNPDKTGRAIGTTPGEDGRRASAVER